MSAFHDFLLRRFELGGFSTEDALASFLPLARQVAQTHASGKVAPLDGVAALQVEGAVLWFPQSAAKPAAANASRIRSLDKPAGGMDILSEHKRTIDVDDGPEQMANLQIGTREQEIAKPVYLPGYICWEHQVGHHDPVSDVFCLGMILASLTCHLDFNQPEDLQSFVAHRRNLFRLNKELHPVLAKAMVRTAACPPAPWPGPGQSAPADSISVCWASEKATMPMLCWSAPASMPRTRWAMYSASWRLRRLSYTPLATQWKLTGRSSVSATLAAPSSGDCAMISPPAAAATRCSGTVRSLPW